MYKENSAMLEAYHKVQTNLATREDDLTAAKTTRDAAVKTFKVGQQAVAVAEAHRESTVQDSQDTAASHKSAQHHEAIVVKHADKSKAALAEVQEIDLTATAASTDNNVKAAAEQSEQAEQQATHSATLVAEGEATVERVQEMDEQATQTVKDVEIKLRNHKQVKAAMELSLEEFEHKQKLADAHKVKVRTQRLKHEEEHSKSVSDAELKLNDKKPKVQPSVELLDKVSKKLAAREESQTLAAKHLVLSTAELAKAQLASTDSAAAEREKKAELQSATRSFENSKASHEEAKEQSEQAKIVEGRAKRDQESMRERGEQAIKRAHDTWSDSEVAVADAENNVSICHCF